MCLTFRPKNHCLILNFSSNLIEQNRVVSSVPEHFIYLILYIMSFAGSKYNKTVQGGKQYT